MSSLSFWHSWWSHSHSRSASGWHERRRIQSAELDECQQHEGWWFFFFLDQGWRRARVSLHFAGVAFALAFGHGCFGSFVVSVPVTWRAHLSVWGGSRKKRKKLSKLGLFRWMGPGSSCCQPGWPNLGPSLSHTNYIIVTKHPTNWLRPSRGGLKCQMWSACLLRRQADSRTRITTLTPCWNPGRRPHPGGRPWGVVSLSLSLVWLLHFTARRSRAMPRRMTWPWDHHTVHKGREQEHCRL
jgi:hypothetical protein